MNYWPRVNAFVRFFIDYWRHIFTWLVLDFLDFWHFFASTAERFCHIAPVVFSIFNRWLVKCVLTSLRSATKPTRCLQSRTHSARYRISLACKGRGDLIFFIRHSSLNLINKAIIKNEIKKVINGFK